MCKGEDQIKIIFLQYFLTAKEERKRIVWGKLFVSVFVIPATHSLTDSITRFNTPQLAP
jgi:hypothetical protein